MKGTIDKIEYNLKVLEYLKINEYITTNIAKDILNLKSKSWTRDILNRMVEENILISEGKNRKYKLN